jgi:nucleoside-diphosphate kinase
MGRTLIIVKPDAVERGLVGEIISRFETAGLAIARMSFRMPSRGRFEEFYAEHSAKPHFERLIAYMTSGPSCFIEMMGTNAVRRARDLVGATDPREAAPGTIRGDLALDLPRNSVHASDSSRAAGREIGLIFGGEGESSSERVAGT